ncbi:LLM class flavin-dependent oxidoreductase [Pseudonocardia pini]|uniref:LLM class flavin-dependent oxidoreductase n=1 Tax=Pseudonocardia pini TaxID=2758030 RepID=UPI0015F08F3C|nr:LLM class flavin-dependent oxidoreductase [Pseudonocardia pini]
MIALNAFLKPPGEYLAAWRHPDGPADGGVNIAHVRALVERAERARFDAVFLADLVGVPLADADVLSRVSVVNDSFEPTTLLAALSAVTSHIGLIATASTTYNEPYHLARTFASLDHLSGGRAGWNLVTSLNDGEARNFGLDAHVPHAERYARAEEFVDVVRGLWAGVDDGALTRHQGHPVIVQAGASEAGKALASRVADVIFTHHGEVAAAQGFRAEIRERARAHGRDPDHVKVLPALSTITGRTRAEAEDKAARMRELLHPRVALEDLGYWLGGVDLTPYPLDGPLPDLPLSNQSRSTQARVLDRARAEGLTIRQLARQVADDDRTLVGTGTEIADHIEEFVRAGAADGFNVIFPYLPGTLEDFADLVVPELQRRGLHRTEYTGRTLREHLGLPRPRSGYATARETP